MIYLILISLFIPKQEREPYFISGSAKGKEYLNATLKKRVPQTDFYTLTVRIFHFFSNEGDEWDGQDTYYKITIDDGYINSTFQTVQVAENNNDYDCEVTYSRVVYDTLVDIRIEVWDSDFWSSDDELNIGGSGSDKSCDITYNVNQKVWWGDTDSLMIRGSGNEYSAIWFYVQSDIDNETPGRYRFDDTLFHSCGLLSGLGTERKRSVFVLSNFWDEYYTFLTSDTIFNSFSSFGNYFYLNSHTVDSACFNIYLYHPYNALLDSSTNPDTFPEIIEIFNPDTGKYFLEFIRDGSSGWIRNFYYGISDKIFLEKDTSFKGFLVYDFQNILYYDWKDEYLFYKNSDEVVNISLYPSTSLDADLFVFDSLGNLICSSENSGYGVPEVIALSQGEGYFYFLIYQRNGRGVYSVNFEKSVQIVECGIFKRSIEKGKTVFLDITGRKVKNHRSGILFMKTGGEIRKLLIIYLKDKALYKYNF